MVRLTAQTPPETAQTPPETAQTLTLSWSELCRPPLKWVLLVTIQTDADIFEFRPHRFPGMQL